MQIRTRSRCGNRLDWIEGRTYCRLGQYEEARKLYESCTALIEEATTVDAWMNAAITYACGLVDVKEGSLSAARTRLHALRTLCSKVRESDPQHHLMAEDYRMMLEGDLLLAEGHAVDAIDLCQRRPELAIPSMPSSDALFYNFPFERDVLARAYVADASHQEAIAEYETLVAFDPSGKDRRLVHPLFHYRVGGLYQRQGFMEKAMTPVPKTSRDCNVRWYQLGGDA